MTVRGQKKNPGFLALFSVFSVLVLAISFVSLFYFNQRNGATDDQDVKFWLYRHAEQEVGEESTFFVFIQNQEKRNLEDAEVVLKFPDGFLLNSSSPACDQVLNQGCLWSLGKIKKGELKEIELKGRLFGRSDQDQMFAGNLNFHLAGFSSSFQKTMSSSIMLKPSLLLNWQLPEQSSFGQTIKSTVSLENVSQEMLSQTEVILSWPENFVLTRTESITLQSDSETWETDNLQRQFRWKIKDLNAGDKKGFEFEGLVADPSSSELSFGLQAGVFYQDKFFLQTEKDKKILLEKFDFNVFLKANDSVREEQTASWGEDVPIKLIFKNQSQRKIKNLDLKLKLVGEQYVDADKLYQTYWHYYQGSDVQDFPVVSSKVSNRMFSDSISSSIQEESGGWNRDLIPDFEEIEPGEEGIIVFALPIKDPLIAAENSYSRARIGLQIVAQGGLDEKQTKWDITGSKIDFLVKTDVSLKASARYYDDEHVTLGNGPLPLQVGKETNLWIFWEIKNTTNPLKDIVVKTKLPDGVSWTGRTKTSQGLILYGEAGREVDWNISHLNVYQGGAYSVVEAGFEVKAVPTADQVNMVLPLTREVVFSGRDEFTNELISFQNGFLDTDLTGDLWGQNKGRVTGDAGL